MSTMIFSALPISGSVHRLGLHNIEACAGARGETRRGQRRLQSAPSYPSIHSADRENWRLRNDLGVPSGL